MTVETVTHISDLNASYPAFNDPKEEGDDHIRNIKTALKTDFANIAGSVTSDHTDLNVVQGLGGATLLNIVYPVGAIYMSTANTSPQTLFGGTWTAIQTGRVLLSEDGGTNYSAGDTGGSTDAIVVGHSHSSGTLSATTAGSHNHRQTLSGEISSSSNGSYISGSSTIVTSRNSNDYTNTDGAHTHTISGDTDSVGGSKTNANMPPYLAVYMWERTA